MVLFSVLQAVLADGNLPKIMAVIGAACIVIGASYGISKIGKTAVESIARQPEASGGIRMSMLLSCALIEGVSLFAVIICMLVAL